MLSLPSFQWFKADYLAKETRQGHSCHVIGNRQLITVGGIDPALKEIDAVSDKKTRDVFPFGVGVFDMTDMKWKDRYDADAPAYKSPKVVREHYQMK